MKILVAVDGSEFTRHMLDHLATHGEWLSPAHEYTVMHVVAVIPPMAASALGHDAVHAYYEEEAEKVLQPVRAFFEQRGASARYIHKSGPAADLLAREAEQGNYDLLMIGSHGHSTLGGLLMGSVSTRTLSKCKTPVLIIR